MSGGAATTGPSGFRYMQSPEPGDRCLAGSYIQLRSRLQTGSEVNSLVIYSFQVISLAYSAHLTIAGAEYSSGGGAALYFYSDWDRARSIWPGGERHAPDCH